MTTTVAVIALLLVGVVLWPVLVYVTAKLWAAGTLRGRQAFRERLDAEQRRQETPDN